MEQDVTDKPARPSVYFTRNDSNELKAALLAVGKDEGLASMSELIERGALELVRKLQRKYNNSRPFNSDGTTVTLRPGQRTREEQHREER